MTEEAIMQVHDMPQLDERRSIVIYNEEWHKGVIGIVASRLTEQYYRPAVVLTRSEGMATGSARSVSGFDVYKAVQSCADLLENFGGHTYAAGLTLKVENIEEFSRRFENYVTEHILDEQTEASLEIDAILDFKDVTFNFYQTSSALRPSVRATHAPSSAPAASTTTARARWWAADRSTSSSNWWTTRATTS